MLKIRILIPPMSTMPLGLRRARKCTKAMHLGTKGIQHMPRLNMIPAAYCTRPIQCAVTTPEHIIPCACEVWQGWMTKPSSFLLKLLSRSRT